MKLLLLLRVGSGGHRGSRFRSVEFRVQGPGVRAPDLGLRVWVSGLGAGATQAFYEIPVLSITVSRRDYGILCVWLALSRGFQPTSDSARIIRIQSPGIQVHK